MKFVILLLVSMSVCTQAAYNGRPAYHPVSAELSYGPRVFGVYAGAGGLSSKNIKKSILALVASQVTNHVVNHLLYSKYLRATIADTTLLTVREFGKGFAVGIAARVAINSMVRGRHRVGTSQQLKTHMHKSDVLTSVCDEVPLAGC